MAEINWKTLIGAKDFDELRLIAFERWQASKSKITNLNIGGVWRTLIELFCQGLADLHTLLVEIVPKRFLKYASGTWVILGAEEKGVLQKLDQKAEGLVIFGRNEATGNKVIPANSIVKTDITPTGEELRYFVTESFVCPDGIGELAVPVIAEFTGAKYNVGQNTIKNMVTHVPGFDYVTNASNWLTKEGADIEDEDSLKDRTRLRWYEFAVGNPAMKYKSWALSVTGVVDCVVNDQHPRGPGTVDVIILSTAGMPTTELINQVQTKINSLKPNTADVLVRAPLTQIINLEILIYLYPTSTAEPSAIQNTATQYTNAFFGQGIVSGITRLKLAQDFVRLDLATKLKNISPTDIKNVKIIDPDDDVTVPTERIAALGTFSITIEKVDEE
ncbi:MAG: baseplate J/gp47 family protein [Bacteroidota bacterium]